ncbi:PREDICTED: uncharacterized protein LOC109232443 [Nicotiana attenuata]|uniref:uncharacterized protein LOC109232443 n=1 Tax=Nicotiana attenuata TaxID=49451 RepID=UPI00090571AE|nr:PREDICTED: uncharacterized protein LOC109232443 [Nicotiana attenuata]
MGSAPTVFHKPAKDDGINGMIVTPDTGIQQRLHPVTFGSFLPQKFQPIREESEEDDEQNLMKENALSKLASVVGKPMYTDKITAEMEKEVQEKAKAVKTQQKGTWEKKLLHKGTLKWMPKAKGKDDVIQQARNAGDIQQTIDNANGRAVNNGKMKGKSVQQSAVVMMNTTNGFSLLQTVEDPRPQMNLCTWNITGLNKAHKPKELKLFMRKHKIDFIGCLETRVKELKAKRIVHKVCSDWRCCWNYKEHPSGRIWLMWRSNIEVQILMLDEQFIHCEVQERSTTFKTLVTVVYASNEVNKRQQLWEKLVNLGRTIQESWLLSGDFNNVLHTDDRIGAPVTHNEIKGFQDALITLQLTQVKSLGWFYTWCNKQQPEKRVYSRID